MHGSSLARGPAPAADPVWWTLAYVKPMGDRSSLSFPNSPIPEKNKYQSSGLRSTLLTSRESVVKSGTALVLAHLDHKLQSAASPEAVFAQKRVMCLDDFYQGAQVVFNLQLPSAAIREGRGRMGKGTPELLSHVLRRGGFLHPALPLSQSQFQLNSKESQRYKSQK